MGRWTRSKPHCRVLDALWTNSGSYPILRLSVRIDRGRRAWFTNANYAHILIRAQIDAFVTDYANALQNAIALDDKILGDASKVSSKYADLVSISTRQVLASLDITVANGADGALNESDVKIFMKDMGQSGCELGSLF